MATPARGRGWRGVFALLAVLCLIVPALAAEPKFPVLTGRIVDGAGLLDSSTRARLEGQLAAHEEKSTDQLVVVTLPDLQGFEIADFGYRLGRFWKVGQKEKNNGALLIVAVKERKVRIEVGYGLEGQLTDALTRVIIETAIVPRFKAGDFAGGITAGVDAMLKVLTGDAAELQKRAAQLKANENIGWIEIAVIAIFLFIVVVIILQAVRGAQNPALRGRRGSVMRGGPVIFGPSSGGFSGGWSSGSDSGGFSGGGGSFGGGGSSGDW